MLQDLFKAGEVQTMSNPPPEAGDAREPSQPTDPPAAEPAGRRKRRLRLFLFLALTAGLLAGALLYWRHAAHFESTDDAFIAGHVTSVSARVQGRVLEVFVNDNQLVRQGEVLLLIDPADYQARNDQAQAALEVAQENLHETMAQQVAAQATAEQSQAQVAAAQAKADYDEKEKKRYDTLLAQRVVSQEVKDNADTTARTSNTVLDAARKKYAADQAQVALATARIATATAQVEQARAALAQTALDLAHTKVHARVPGRVTNKAVEPGDYLQVGQAVMSIVQPDVWILANFKETQLTDMRPGQPVAVTVDAFPDTPLTGRVDSIQRGTGAAFSLLPPENATGNYVKVVQRVPVKIVLDQSPAETGLLLAPGMSVVPTVRVR